MLLVNLLSHIASASSTVHWLCLSRTISCNLLYRESQVLLTPAHSVYLREGWGEAEVEPSLSHPCFGCCLHRKIHLVPLKIGFIWLCGQCTIFEFILLIVVYILTLECVNRNIDTPFFLTACEYFLGYINTKTFISRATLYVHRQCTGSSKQCLNHLLHHQLAAFDMRLRQSCLTANVFNDLLIQDEGTFLYLPTLLYGKK